MNHLDALADQPLVIEIGGDSWNDFADSLEAWLGNTLMAQVAFRQLAEQVAGKLREPHAKDYVRQIAETAKTHEAKAEGFFEAIGRDPSKARKAGGTALAGARRALGDLLGPAGGAESTWSELNQLFLASQHSQGAFAVVEQLALALGLRQMAEAAFAIENEKSKHHLVLQELLLELAAMAILYKAQV